MSDTKLKAVAPQPSRELVQFLEKFHGKHIFAAYHPEGKGNPQLSGKHFPTDIYSCYNYLLELQNMGYGIYFTVNEPEGRTRKAEDIQRIRAVFIDDDMIREDGPRTDFVLKPSIIVETSKGKYHYYWLCSTINMSEWSDVQKALIHIHNTDPTIKDLSRVMRLPEFNHHSGFKSRVVGGTNKMHTWETIVDHYPPIPTELLKDLPSTSGRSQADMMRIIVEGKADTGLHAATRDLAWGMLKDGKSPSAAIKFLRDLMVGYDLTDARQQENYNVVERTVLSAAKKLKAQGVDPENGVTVQPLERDWSYLLVNNIPKEAIPDCIASAAKEVGEFTCAGEVPAILSAVVITSALLGRNVLIHEIEESLLQRPRMGLVVAMHTGTVKTRVYELMCEPFFKYQEKLQKDYEEQKHKMSEEIDMLKTKKQKILSKYRRSDKIGKAEEALMLKELELISKRVEWLSDGKPYLYIDDSTEERLVTKMYANHGQMAVLSDDARNTMKNIMGLRYSHSTGGEGTYIAGLTGSTIDSNRQKDGGTDITIHDPVLNLLLFIQPDMATRFKTSDVYLESGLAARMPIYYYPITGDEIISKRDKRQRVPLNMEKVAEYYQALYRLCIRSPFHSLVVRLSENAKKRHIEMDSEFYQKLQTDWRGHYDKTNKISTLIVIYATVFAALDDPKFAEKLRDCAKLSDVIHREKAAREVTMGENYTGEETGDNATTFGEITYTISAKYINMGWQFAQALFSQSIESYEELDKQPIVSAARLTINNIANLYTKGTIFEGFPDCAAFGNMMPLAVRPILGEVLTHLVDKGWLVTTMRLQVEGKGRLNNGMPNKIVKPGDGIYHLNRKGIIEARKNYAENPEKWNESDLNLLNSINVE